MSRQCTAVGLSLLLMVFAQTLIAATPVLSRHAYQTIQSAQALLSAGKTIQAIKALKKLVDTTAARPYEQAVALQSLAHAEMSRDRPAAALELLERSLALAALPDDAQQRTRYNLAQLYMVTERFAPAVEQLQQWFAKEAQPTAEAHALFGSAHLQLKHYRSAVEPLRQAIALSKQPRESWYQSLLGAHSELKQYDQCAKLLRTMLKLFPTHGAYWRQLAGIELLRQRYRDALAVMELAYLRGHLESERDLLNLAQLYAQRNAPYKAAQLIEKEIAAGRIRSKRENWEQAANAWYQARETERSIAALKNAINHVGAKASLELRLAQLYFESEQWRPAENALLSVIKGKLTDAEAGRAWLLLGIVRHNREAFENAKAAFFEAAKLSATKEDAANWLAYLQSLEPRSGS